MTATEYVVLVDNQNRDIGVCEKLNAHEKCLLHRAFSVFIFRNHSELLLQQRALGKYHSAGLWTNTCCSHPRSNEDILQAAQRRLQEEFGFSADLVDFGWFHYTAHFPNGLSENEIDHVLVGNVSNNVLIAPNPDEVLSYRWVSLDALAVELKASPELFTPWFEQALKVAVGK